MSLRTYDCLVVHPKQDRSFDDRACCNSHCPRVHLSEFTRINAALDHWDQDIPIAIDVFL